jgi:hypothetical protein
MTPEGTKSTDDTMATQTTAVVYTNIFFKELNNEDEDVQNERERRNKERAIWKAIRREHNKERK